VQIAMSDGVLVERFWIERLRQSGLAVRSRPKVTPELGLARMNDWMPGTRLESCVPSRHSMLFMPRSTPSSMSASFSFQRLVSSIMSRPDLFDIDEPSRVSTIVMPACFSSVAVNWIPAWISFQFEDARLVFAGLA